MYEMMDGWDAKEALNQTKLRLLSIILNI